MSVEDKTKTQNRKTKWGRFFKKGVKKNKFEEKPKEKQSILKNWPPKPFRIKIRKKPKVTTIY